MGGFGERFGFAPSAAERTCLDGSFGEWSDVNLQIVVDDDRVEGALAAVESALADVSPIDGTFRLPEPVRHGHSQALYRLRDASPYLLLDLVAMKLSNESRFLQFEIHGRPFVCFDESGVVDEEAFDAAAVPEKIRGRIESLFFPSDVDDLAAKRRETED